MYQLAFFLRELKVNLSRSPLMSVAAASTATISLLTLGISLMMVYTINNLSAEITSQVEIRAFLESDVTNYEIKNLQEKIFEMPQIRSIEYVSPDRALDKLQEDLSIELDISPEENPLPHALVIRVTDPRQIGIVADQVREMKGVTELKYGKTILQGILKLSLVVKFLGYLVTMLMGAGALFTIMNTIRLTVIARQEEIRTMQLVGATQWFIRWPFLLEGVFLGAVGGFVAAMVLAASYYALGGRIQNSLPFIIPLVKASVMSRMLFVLLLLAGCIMGVAGSYISITRFLGERSREN